MTKDQVLFFGTSDIGIPTLDVLAKDGRFDIQLVVTQPDKKVGRSQKITQCPIKTYAQHLGLPVATPEILKGNKEFLDLIRELKPDLFVVFSYGHILPAELLNIPKYGAINVHASLLPEYRGASPIQQAILDGKKDTGITIMRMNEKMDEGDVIYIRRIAIAPDETAESLKSKVAVASSIITSDAISAYRHGELSPIPQDHSRATFCKKIEKEDGEILWKKMDAQEIERRIRAFTPWPGCWTMWRGKRIKILGAKIAEEDGAKKISAGKIIIVADVNRERCIVGTRKGELEILALQLEGKDVMNIKDFINGYRQIITQHPTFESDH